MSFDILLTFSRVKRIRGTVVLWELVNPQKLDKWVYISLVIWLKLLNLEFVA